MRLFYHPDLWAPSYEFETTRKPLWLIESLQSAPIPNITLTLCTPTQKKELIALHNEEYIEAVRTGEPRDLACSPGFVWDEGIYPMALAACGCMRDAALDALLHKTSGSLGGGFHHAKRHKGQGCCTFQGTVLAANTALEEGAEAVLIIDVDAHCAGGTHSLIQDNPKIWQLDLSTSPVDGYKAKAPNTLDLIRSASRYLGVLQERLTQLEHTGPRFGLCIYKAGMDVFEGCDTGGLSGINEALLQERERLVFSWCKRRQIPVAFGFAGGYVGPRLSKEGLLSLHRLTLRAALEG